MRHTEAADDRWSIQWRQIVLRRPWLRGSSNDVTLMGLESAKPRFVVGSSSARLRVNPSGGTVGR